MQIGWIASSSGKERYISANANNVILSSYFTESEWKSGATKTVIIEPGVTVGSTTNGTSSLRTGTTVNGSALGGKLILINNGNIYGAGGPVTSTVGLVGGTALEASILINVTNNGNIYGGGGGGGNGGEGARGYYYPDDKTWKYSWNYWTGGGGSIANYWVSWYGGHAGSYTIANPDVAFSGTSINATTHDYAGWRYQRGDLVGPLFLATYYKIRRRSIGIIAGGDGGSGGKGAGSDNLIYDNGSPGLPATVSSGGNGGNGGNWGLSGNGGQTGGVSSATHVDQTHNPEIGFTAGLGGYYINGDSNVIWSATGNRIGRVTG